MTLSIEAAPVPVRIRDYVIEDEGRVLRLLITSLGGGSGFIRDANFWKWKHFANPFGTSQLLVATTGEDVAGLRAFLRWQFRVPEGEVRAVRAVDTATHPDQRRLGIFSRLTAAALDRAKADGVDLIFNTPNAHSMPGYLKLGWTRLDPPRLLVRPLRLGRIAVALIRRGRQTPIGNLVSFRRPVDTVRSLLEAKGIEDLIQRDDMLRTARIRTARSVEYLGWRYGRVPSIEYAAIWTGPLAQGAAAILRSKIRNSLREVMLSEMLIGDASGRAADDLFAALVASTDADYLIASAVPGSVQWASLRRNGFLPLPKAGLNFTVLALNWPSQLPDPTRLVNWDLSIGDLEIF